MDNLEYFRAKRYNPKNEESVDIVNTDDLLNLIDNVELKEIITNKYGIDKSYSIEIEKIGFVFNQIKKYSTKFELIRLQAKESDVTCELEIDPKSKEPHYIFNINNGYEDNVLFDSIKATAIYDSVNLFYKNKSLTQYVKSLQKNPSKKSLLTDLNSSWSNYYVNNKNFVKTKLFRILKADENYYLKSINSTAYKEYGIAESFVMAVLELWKFKKSNQDADFYISSVSIGEAKLDLIVTRKKTIKLGVVGFLRSSISIRNEDQGNTSFGVHNTLEFYSNANTTDKIYLFPNQDQNHIKNSVVSTHIVSPQTFVDTFSSISNLFEIGDQIKQDFYFYNEAKNYDELRFKIESRLITNNSPFKGIKQLKELFSKEKTGHIENLETLLKICAKADSIEMDYDVKFKLRYLISNVLLYNSNNY